MQHSIIFRVVILLLLCCSVSFAKTARGIVEDAHGRPVANATVILQSEGAAVVRSCISATDGSFHFVNLHPEMYYKLQARRGKHDTNTVRISRFDSLKDESIQLKFSVPQAQLE